MFLKWHILTVLNCVQKISKKLPCIVDCNKISNKGSVSEPLLILILGEVFFRTGVHNCCIFLEYWYLALGWGHYGSTARDLISLYITNHIQPSKFVSIEDEPYQLFSWIQFIFPSTKTYYIRHINYYFNRLYRNRYISSTVYINQKYKSF